MGETLGNSRLAAILAADVVGYSRLMSHDEAGTFAALQDIWRRHFNPFVEEHNGRIVKTMGDGALVEFNSAAHAVLCAVQIQQDMADYNAEKETGKRIDFRIGVNLGDIIIDGDDIFGEGVNIAARLESKAPTGGLLISDSVYNIIANKLEYRFVDEGLAQFKNIDKPIRVWSWCDAIIGQDPPVQPGVHEADEAPSNLINNNAPYKDLGLLPDLDADAAGLLPAKVLIPTTGGMIWIEGLRERPKLRTSYAALKGDFRPLNVSPDYHRFVTGPLLSLTDDGPYELTLSAEFDSGRSWEFPVLVAHLLHARGQFAPNSPASSDEAMMSGEHVVWATGKIDPELNPIPGDYQLARKLTLARPIFADILKNGGRVSLLISAALADSDKKLMHKFADENGITCVEISDFAELQKFFGFEPTGLAVTGEMAAYSGPAKPVNLDQNLGPLGRLPLVALFVAAFATILGYILYDRFRPDPPIVKIDDLVMEGLYAKNRNDCIQRIWSGHQLDSEPLSLEGSMARIPLNQGFCGLRLRNVGEETITLTLSKSLAGYSIGGDNPLFKGSKVGTNARIELIFRQQPEQIAAKLTINKDTGPPRKIDLKFLKTAPEK